MILHGILVALTFLSLGLTLWQWLAARRFPLHRRCDRSAGLRPGVPDREAAQAAAVQSPALPSVTLLKPLKGTDEHTEACLRSWFTQDYAGDIQLLFAVTDAGDPVCEVVQKLLREFSQHDARLVICAERRGANAKVSKLAQLQPLAKHGVLVVSDADVRVPAELLTNLVAPLVSEWRATGTATRRAGLVNCFYHLANPTTPAMRCEAVAINADFWSQVLQSRDLKPLDFALGAVMAVRREALEQISGFAAFVDHLADDYQLGNRVARAGWGIELCPVVVECWDPPKSWGAVWSHQLRWARTIRVCQPAPFFFSILSNGTLWPLLLGLASLPGLAVEARALSPHLLSSCVQPSSGLTLAAAAVLLRILAAGSLQRRLTQSRPPAGQFWLVPMKDLMQAAVWLLAFAGNRIEWRGERYRLRHDGRLELI